VADPTDPDPSLTLRWAKPRTVTSLHVELDPLLAATRPDHLAIDTPVGGRAAVVQPDGWVTFAPVRTNRMTVHFGHAALTPNIDPEQAVPRLGVGVSELAVTGVRPKRWPARPTAAVSLPCGSAPAISIDGTTIRTRVVTTVGDLLDQRPIALRTCGRATVGLTDGTHRLEARDVGPWSVSGVLLRSGTAATGGGAVPVDVQQWGAERRSVRVGSRAEPTLLAVHENSNPGWQATAGGRRLAAVTVDGWQQGWLLPPGPATVVALTYAPDGSYRAWLLFGLVLAVLLVVLAALRPGRHRRAPPPAPALRVGAWPALGLLAAALLLVGGVPAVLLAVGWALILTVLRSRLRGRYSATAAGVLAGACYLVAGGCLAVAHWARPGYAAPTAALTLLCLSALALVALPNAVTAAPAAVLRRRRAARGRAAVVPVPRPRGS
jgi:arabinofuranan 3-O-arabinosyltransferase